MDDYTIDGENFSIRNINKTIIVADTLANFKAIVPNTKIIVFLAGSSTMADPNNGFYYWKVGDTTADDADYFNVISSTVDATGKWNRLFVRVLRLPQGVLVFNGKVKTLYVTGVTNSSGEASINLTMENTAAGTSIFTEIWDNKSSAIVNASTPNDAIGSCVKTETLKVTNHLFYKGNNAVLSVLGTAFNGFRAAATGISVRFVVVGI